MAFCGNCGSELDKESKFCVSCGNKLTNVAENSANNPVPFQGKLNFLAGKSMKRNLIIGAGALLVIVVVAAITLGPKSLHLTKAQARDVLMQPSDFSFDVSEPESPVTIMDTVAWVIFDAGASECSEDGKISSIIKDHGTLLATTDLNGTSTYFNEDIVEFNSDQDPAKVISLIKDGYANPYCDYDGDGVQTTFSDLGTSKSKLGVGPENSAYFSEDSDWSSSGYDFLSSHGGSVIIADGRFLISLRMSGSYDNISVTEARAVLTRAVEKIYK